MAEIEFNQYIFLKNMKIFLCRLVHWIWNIAAIASFFMLFLHIYAQFFGHRVKAVDAFGVCKYTFVAEYPSPNKKRIAKIGYSDCGATTNWRTTLILFDSASRAEYAGLFGLNGKPGDLKVSWSSESKLQISNFKLTDLQWFKQDYSSGVEIELNSIVP